LRFGTGPAAVHRGRGHFGFGPPLASRAGESACLASSEAGL
jgi:hypothetical protein